jgi:hypothetical protein
VLAVNLGGGGIHCITMNEPAVYWYKYILLFPMHYQ